MARQQSDIDLKLRYQKVLWWQGYTTLMEVDLSSYEETKTGALRRKAATDIDVLGLRFESDFHETRVVCDCKGGGQSEPNRMFWLRGLKEYLGASKAVFLKRRQTGQARALASKLQLSSIDSDGLARIEDSLDLQARPFPPTDPRELQGQAALASASSPRKLHLAKERTNAKIAAFNRYLFWFIEDHRAFHSLLARLEDAREDLRPNLAHHCFLVNESLLLLSIAAMRIAAYIVSTDACSTSDQAQLYLAGGRMAHRERRRIRELVRSLSLDPEAMPDPSVNQELFEVLETWVQAGALATQIPRVLFCLLFQLSAPTKYTWNEMLGQGVTPDLASMTRRFVEMVVNSTGISSDLAQAAMDL